MSKISDRIKEIIDYKCISIRQFEQKIGTSNGVIAKIISKNTDLSSLWVSKIIEIFPEISAEWLLTGNGEMLKPKESTLIESTNSVCEPDINYSIPTKSKNIYIEGKDIPLVNIEAIAGFGGSGFAIQKQDIQALYKVPDFNGIDFMIRVKGNSMYPKYSSGDIIACRILKDSKFIEWNKPHLIATTEHGLIVKRLRKSEQDDCLKAISDNSNYDPFDIPKEEIIGIAIIVGVIRLE